LTVEGDSGDDLIFINGTAVNIGSRAANDTGIESVRVGGGDGDDVISLVDVVAGPHSVLAFFDHEIGTERVSTRLHSPMSSVLPLGLPTAV